MGHYIFIPNALIPNIDFPNYSNHDRNYYSLIFPMDHTKSPWDPLKVAVSRGNGNREINVVRISAFGISAFGIET